ncbi:caspase family protein [Actinoplanes sp. NPDC026670]|uniref:wHTH domain-containing protein n=1 Tax=Actinoplanes sp. NPDC026670 TaxID=3154700 RepID=UPI0033EE0978
MDVTERAALLIGVPSYDSELFESFPHVVEADLRRMRDVLEKSDYSVTTCGMGDQGDGTATMNEIRREMKTALRQAPSGGVLLIYYTGHGVVIDGKSYLVPRDAFDDPDGIDVESLVPLVPPGVQNSPAQLIVFFVDACRNEVSDSSLDPSGGGELPVPPNGAFVVVNSCSPGEWSGFSEDGSYFTHALAEALDRRSQARTLEEVIAEAKRQLKRRSALSDDIEQNPREASSRSGLTDEVITSTKICHGEQVVESWQQAAEATALWKRAAGPVHEIKKAVVRIVGACASHWLDARTHLHEGAGLFDVWSSPEHAPRVLTMLEKLVPEATRLSPTELAAVITTPFVREVMLDAGLRLAAGIHPEDFSKRYGERARSDLEITHDQHEHVWRRAEGLDRRGRVEARGALAMWLVHRWLSGRASLARDAEVVERIEEISATASGESGLTGPELCSHLGVLLRCADGGLDEETLLADLTAKAFDQRLRTLGALLWLSGVLAADARRMPSIVVDHIGVTDELSLPDLHDAIRKVEWHQPENKPNELALFSICGHPALYTVFEGVARRAGRVLQAVRALQLDAGLAHGLPQKFTHDLLRPEYNSGRPLFETPPLQFRLSDEKVRELLMGRQLYGEPELAIRELYQNALDACRYRRTRREYLSRTRSGRDHRIGAEPPEWEGRIVISQGVHNGREYIECSDNGVGMSAQILKNTFTNAGERFIYQPAFRAENARWQELDPPLELIPNSQFGVGVFSYFMIAEEIEIETWPTDTDDNLEKDGSFVRIASSGSLFQIEPRRSPRGGGTVVRLYLTGEDKVSVLKTMRRLLWTSEFRVTVTEDGVPPEVWERDELRYSGTAVTPLAHGEDFWWVNGEGGLAADGIRTNEDRYGLVVNLRGRRRPRFTVDRNRLRRWDREWIDRQVVESLPALADWHGFTFNWLWNLTEKTPEIGQTIFDWLVENDRTLRLQGSFAHGTAPPAALIGCLHLDSLLFKGVLNGWGGGFYWLTAWRAGVWRGYAGFKFMERVAIPESVAGYPVVRPLDASILGDLYDKARRGAILGRAVVSELLAAAANETESPAVRLRRLRRFAITGLNLRATRYIPPVDRRFHSDDRHAADGTENQSLLLAVPAWTRPGEPPRPDAGCWLVLASEQLQVSLLDVVERAARLVPPDWEPPDPAIVSALGQRIFEAADIDMISRRDPWGERWINQDVPPSQIMRMSARLGRSVPEVLAGYEKLAPLGFVILGGELMPHDVSAVEHEALLLVDRMKTPLTIFHMMMLADQHQITVEAVVNHLSRIRNAGFITFPDEFGADIGFVPGGDEITVVREYLYYYDPRTSDRKLAVGWLAFRGLVWHIHSGSKDTVGDRIDKCRRLLDLADPRRPVTVPEVLVLACDLSMTMSQAIQFYEMLLPQTADLSLLPSTAFGSDLDVHWPERFALTNWLEVVRAKETEVTWSVNAADLVGEGADLRVSATVLIDSLEPFREVGAPLPVLEAADRAELASHVVDRFDERMLRALDDDDGVWFEPISEISPLHLVRIAGEFGWTPAQTRIRMARFVPLGLTMDIPAEACDEEIVSWQDLLVLTTYLDGQEPALSGEVSVQHLADAAEEIGETVAEVRDRLTRFTGLFGFTLAPAPDEGTTQDA